MATLGRRFLLPIALLGLSALAGAGGFAFLLEGSAERARARETAAAEARLIAEAAADGGAGAQACLARLMKSLLASKPEFAYLRAQDGNGWVLSEAGDRGGAADWLDRTYGGPGGPVRVQVGYRAKNRAVARGIRTAAWTALAATFVLAVLATLSILLRRHVAAPLEALTAWLERGGERPAVRGDEFRRLADAAEARFRDAAGKDRRGPA